MLSIGDIIRTNREEQHISQEALSFGICSVSNLSRIENGTQTPTRATYEALMQRMGLSPELFPSFTSEHELEAYRLKHAVNQKFNAERYDEAGALLDKLHALPKLERVYEQYVLYCRALLLREAGGDPADVLTAMQKVVAQSVQHFTPKKILRCVLTKDELSMLNNLGLSYIYAGDKDAGIDILYAVKEYIERKVVDDEGITSMYTAILFNLSNEMGRMGRHDEVLRLCEIGIARCIEYGRYFSFAGLLFNKGNALLRLGRKEEAQKLIQEAYYVDRARSKTGDCEIMMRFAEENGITI